MARLTLVLGGARSGKSRQAEAITTAGPPPWHYVATAQALDDEMAGRITRHRNERVEGWITHEIPLALAATLDRLGQGTAPVLVECLTLWLSNVMLDGGNPDEETERLEQVMASARAPIVLVSNEVGLGIVPDNALARRFRDAQGRLNQRLAARADEVLLMVAGLPIVAKG
jgi:adenosylcobinamide kinase/adenosylcobinamide-phosphate guanylyltransferase